ncbi:hypothetical protein GH714_043941 [Hevea brasiliensis]|uniref:Chromo domain-containing protein n=1 Tax=Hevea brasiliensis TaxID=3981 RepID=A0A6A6JYZ9_HEVBR|nr:hypothetical protein GH714_043941 [Hevea brasiliensis]
MAGNTGGNGSFSQTGLPGELGSNWVLLEQMRLSLRARAQNEVHCWHRACWAEGRPKTRFRRPSAGPKANRACGSDLRARQAQNEVQRARRGPEAQTGAREQQADSARGNEVQMASGKARRARDEVVSEPQPVKEGPTAVTTTFERDVEEILAHREVPQRGIHPGYKEYLVKWKMPQMMKLAGSMSCPFGNMKTRC